MAAKPPSVDEVGEGEKEDEAKIDAKEEKK